MAVISRWEIGTLFIDMGLLVLFVRLWNLPYVPAAALAILIAFHCPVCNRQELGMEGKSAP